MKELANEIVKWLKNYATKNGSKGWVVGVSGGVDSALVSTLCAMTGLPTHCVVLPCQTNILESSRGDRHIEWLKGKFPNVTYNKISLINTFYAFHRATNGSWNNDLAYANTKSRLRMIALYQIACCTGGFVVGTGNKVEDFGIGFFTKYGDGGVDISPISDLTKSEVRQMSRELDIHPDLSEAIATDGLWGAENSRTDEDAIGATYVELEWAMQWVEDSSKVLTEWLTERQKQVLEIYTKRHAATMHKLSPIPTFTRQ